MNLLIIGCTGEGARLANRLSKEGHAVSVVDRQEESFSLLSPEYSGYVTAGIPIDQDVLIRAGIENCDTVLAVTDDDNTNIMACELARTLFRVGKVIAKVNDSEKETVFRQMGIETFSSTRATADALRSILLDEETSRLRMHHCEMTFRWEAPPQRLIGVPAGQIQGTDRENLIGIFSHGTLFLVHSGCTHRVEETDRFIVATIAGGENP